MDKEPCAAAGCERDARARGLCHKHYVRLIRTGTTDDPKPRGKKVRQPCSVDGCEAPAFCHGWCRRHYTRWYETGSLELGARTGDRRHLWRDPAERFWPKVARGAHDECWEWTGGKTGLGYGIFWISPDEGRVMAHRYAYELLRSTIPEGLVLDHLCRNPSCVNPWHLEPVTVAENTRRGLGPNRGSEWNRRKTHCPQGHPYEGSNLHINKRGGRVCRTCGRDRQRERRRRMKE